MIFFITGVGYEIYRIDKCLVYKCYGYLYDSIEHQKSLNGKSGFRANVYVVNELQLENIELLLDTFSV